jgi:di/tricarboxylate transporter
VANPAAQALPGGYRFGDYANVGLPMLALPMVSTVILARLIYL